MRTCAEDCDLERITRMLKSQGIAYTKTSYAKEGNAIEVDRIEIIVERGYAGFYTKFTFSSWGDFKDIAALE